MLGLSFFEHETVKLVGIAGLSDAGDRLLTFEEADEIQRLGSRLGVRIASYVGRDCVRFTNFVGLISVAGRAIEILPKIGASTDKTAFDTSRINLLKMLFVTNDLEKYISDQSLSESTAHGWLDTFIQLFCELLSQQVRTGLVKRYRIDVDDLAVLRGRLIIQEQIARNFVHKERFACEFDELDEDHPLNQMIKLALSLMLFAARSEDTRNRIRVLMGSFEMVSGRMLAGNWWKYLEVDRISARFRGVIRLAQIFLSGLSPNIALGRDKSFSLLFDMNALFESYIGKKLARAFSSRGLRVGLQHSVHYLLSENGSGKKYLKLRPDIVVYDEGEVLCIIDAKWKNIDDTDGSLGVGPSDIYQMLAYSGRYGCDKLMLIFPQSNEFALGTRITTYQVQGMESIIFVARVNLWNLDSVEHQLDMVVTTLLH